MKDNAFMPKKYRGFVQIYHPKKEWKPVRPPKYVYHLTRGGIRCRNEEDLYYHRLSIYLYGLFGKDKGTGGVWANRDLHRLSRAYPIVLDGFEWGRYEYADGLESYDVWRIDTTKLHNKWYLDPNMQDAPGFYDGRDYVYTEKSIPPFALKLFNIKVDAVHLYLYPCEQIRFELIPVQIRV